MHERLQGTILSVCSDGVQRRVWKTKLAGKYAANLVHAWAALLADAAPPGCRSHEPTVVSPHWEREVRRAVGEHGAPSSVKLENPYGLKWKPFFCVWKPDFSTIQSVGLFLGCLFKPYVY